MAAKRHPTKLCEFCEVDKVRMLSELDDDLNQIPGKYCSPKCRHRSFLRKNPGYAVQAARDFRERHPMAASIAGVKWRAKNRPPVVKPLRDCEHCGEPSGTRMYCGDPCKGAAWRSRQLKREILGSETFGNTEGGGAVSSLP